MKRKEFFKRLGLGAAAAIIAPKVIASALEEELKVKEGWELLNKADLLSEKDLEVIEWYEQGRIHVVHDAEVIFSDKHTHLAVSKEAPFRLHDIIMIDNEAFVITDIMGVYRKEVGDRMLISVASYSDTSLKLKEGDKHRVMLIGNDYLARSDN